MFSRNEGGRGGGEVLHSFTKIPLFLFSEGSPTEPETSRPMNRRIGIPKDRRFFECTLKLFVVCVQSPWSVIPVRAKLYGDVMHSFC